MVSDKPARPDFAALKRSISMDRLCDRYGVRLKRVNEHALRGACPLPTHPTKDGNSFAIDTAKNVWSCHQDACVKARGGRKGGDLISFVAVMEQCSLRNAGMKLQEWFRTGGGGRAPRTAPEAKAAGALYNRPLAFELKDVAYHPYLEKRGILQSTAATFGVGYFPGTGSMAGRVVFPIHNERGELVAYAGRTLDGGAPRYKFPAGFRKGLELWNLHRVAGDEIVVVEGFFDALTVHQAGFNVVALMGCALTDAQERLLMRFQRITLVLDGDPPGTAASAAIAARLVKARFVRVVELPDGKQPDMLSADELRAILS